MHAVSAQEMWTSLTAFAARQRKQHCLLERRQQRVGVVCSTSVRGAHFNAVGAASSRQTDMAAGRG